MIERRYKADLARILACAKPDSTCASISAELACSPDLVYKRLKSSTDLRAAKLLLRIKLAGKQKRLKILRSRRRINPEKVVELRRGGMSIAEISKTLKCAPSMIGFVLKGQTTFRRKCVLEECQIEFVTSGARQQCCCRKHVKRLINRRRLGLKPVYVQCALPECQNSFWTVNTACCSVSCAKRDFRRKKNGFYARLLGRGPACHACGERGVVDEHHTGIVPGRLAKHATARPNKSNKHGPSIYLCPTHHMKIHRGLAEVVDGRYVDLVPVILAGLKTKQPWL